MTNPLRRTVLPLGILSLATCVRHMTTVWLAAVSRQPVVWTRMAALVLIALCVGCGPHPIQGDAEPRLFTTRSRLAEFRIICVRMASKDKLDLQKITACEIVTQAIESGVVFPERAVHDWCHDAWGQELVVKITAGQSGVVLDAYSIGSDGVDEHGDGDDISIASVSFRTKPTPQGTNGDVGQRNIAKH